MSRPTDFVGILGWPLERTLSPTIHNAAFRKLGLDWVYLSFPVRPEHLQAAVDGLRALGARGANVTMPHKSAVVPHLDALSGDAEVLGAVNTIQEVGGRLVGHNTDVDGFGEFLGSDAGIDPRGRVAVVLGAGGAARAVVKALMDRGAGRVTVVCRDPAAGRSFGERFDGVEVAEWPRGSELATNADLIVNATPVGTDGVDPIPRAAFSSGQAVVDLIYTPPSTPLVERARRAGADAWGGLGMLVHQAVASSRIWTGQEPPIASMSAAALHSLGGILRRTDDNPTC